jgi:hypothetical protein
VHPDSDLQACATFSSHALELHLRDTRNKRPSLQSSDFTPRLAPRMPPPSAGLSRTPLQQAVRLFSFRRTSLTCKHRTSKIAKHPTEIGARTLNAIDRSISNASFPSLHVAGLNSEQLVEERTGWRLATTAPSTDAAR